MSFHTRPEHAAMSEINVTPLVDVMLVLLVVFIVTAPLLTQAVKVDLPKTVAAPPLKELHAVQVSLDAAGGIFLDRRPLGMADLEKELAKLAKQGALEFRLHADDTVPYGRVAQVMALAQRAGIRKMAMVTVLR